jgi:hypothetical protein
MLERTGRDCLSGCSCLVPALSPGCPITVRRLASVTDTVRVRNSPEPNDSSAPNATSAEHTPVCIILHVTFGPCRSVGRARCVGRHQPGSCATRKQGAPWPGAVGQTYRASRRPDTTCVLFWSIAPSEGPGDFDQGSQRLAAADDNEILGY